MKKRILAILFFSATANANCILDSYQVVGNQLKTCQPNIAASGSSYRGDPVVSDLSAYLQTLQNTGKSEPTLTELSVMTMKNSGNGSMTISADKPEDVATLKKLATEVNDYFGWTPKMKALADKEAQQHQTKPVPNLKTLGDMAYRNNEILGMLKNDCTSKHDQDDFMDAVQLTFPIDNLVNTVLPVALVPDKVAGRYILYFKNSKSVEQRTVYEDSGKIYYVGKDGKAYEVNMARTSSDQVDGTKIRVAGDDRSAACVLAAVPDSGMPQPTDSNNGIQPAAQ